MIADMGFQIERFTPMGRRNRLKCRFRNRSNRRHKGRPPRSAGHFRIGGQGLRVIEVKPGIDYIGPAHGSCGGAPKYASLMLAALEKAKAAGQIEKGYGFICPFSMTPGVPSWLAEARAIATPRCGYIECLSRRKSEGWARQALGMALCT